MCLVHYSVRPNTPLACCAQPPPPSAYTQAYAAEGFFTGVRSSISIKRPPAAVYDSLSTDLHKIFGPITVSAPKRAKYTQKPHKSCDSPWAA